METVLITLHGEQLGSVVPAPEGVIPHAAIERHVAIRVNDYFGSRHIANMYFMGPMLDDGKYVLGYYIVESDESGDEDLVFKIEDLTLKKVCHEDDFSPEDAIPRFPTLTDAVHYRFLKKIADGCMFICSKCSGVQQGGGQIVKEKYDQSGGIFLVDVACNSCNRSNHLREVRTYAQLFSYLQEAVSDTNPYSILPESSHEQ